MAGVQRVLSKCQRCVDDGNFYEAHQMYRTLYFRYMNQKKYTEAVDLLYNGSLTLLKHNQYSSGADLAMLLIEVLKTSFSPVTEDTIDKIVDLFKNMHIDCPERQPFMAAAVFWSTGAGNQKKSGHPVLHQKFAIIFWQEKNYLQARYHFLHSSDGQTFSTMLIEFNIVKGYPSEVDLFLAQAVLQYLCLQNKDTAQSLFKCYTRDHPDVNDGPPFLFPLLNFLWFLLLALDGGKLPVFTVLCEKYETSINRDPLYKEYLDRIGQLFFGLPPRNNNQPGFLGNILQSLLEGQGQESGGADGHSSNRQSTGKTTHSMAAVELD
ncbi:hypothetical protein ScPMuIL_005050 [Solemya velum]